MDSWPTVVCYYTGFIYRPCQVYLNSSLNDRRMKWRAAVAEAGGKNVVKTKNIWLLMASKCFVSNRFVFVDVLKINDFMSVDIFYYFYSRIYLSIVCLNTDVIVVFN